MEYISIEYIQVYVRQTTSISLRIYASLSLLVTLATGVE